MKKFLNYQSAIQYLFHLEHFGVKLGLERILRLLELLGNPQEAFPSILVAGTNGKGSTASFLASCLKAAGFKTGLFTSPHLVNFEERIAINGQIIPQEAVWQWTGRLYPFVQECQATFFETATAMALGYFKEEQIDLAVLEVGMGGRLDATNVVTPLASVITSIEFDHMNKLGNTLESIAWEKAGII